MSDKYSLIYFCKMKISCVNDYNLDLLKAFLNLIPVNNKYEHLNDKNTEVCLNSFYLYK